MLRRLPLLLAAALAALATPAAADPRARVVLVNFDAGTGVGLDDPTPVAPIGGNTGTTLGAQRQIALAHAASIWARNLRSFVPIEIAVTFSPRTCTPTGAVLASAGPAIFLRDFGKWTTQPNHWYPIALANKLGRADFVPVQIGTILHYDIAAIFNINLGNPGCLTGIPFYYGLDGNEGRAASTSWPPRYTSSATAWASRDGQHQSPRRATFGQLLGGFPDVYPQPLRQHHRQDLAGDDRHRARACRFRTAATWSGSDPTSRRRFRRGWPSGCLCSVSARRPPSPANTTSAPPSSAVL